LFELGSLVSNNARDKPMIELLLEQAGEPSLEKQFLREVSALVSAAMASAGAGDRRQVARIEAAVRANPEGSFHFDATGLGTLRSAGASIPAGRFEIPSIGALRKRATEARTGSAGSRVRLWVLDGASPATDIGSLQATAGPGTLFQVASQFNCLESPGPYITPVAKYFSDPTQGPRASISAYPGTLLRHYAAPGDGGNRFVQTNDGPQLNLLESVCSPGIAEVRSGYLTSSGITDRSAFRAALEDRFDDIRVGVHDNVPVILGYNWDGGVAGTRHIGQVFTSTFAGGGYSGASAGDSDYRPICTTVLRAAYVGTLLAAAALGRPKVVLTLIGGGVFGNPVRLIWESICWAINEVEPLLSAALDVVVNGRNLGDHIRVEDILPTVRARGGVVVVFASTEVSVRR
jgi:hypothetical protein